MLTLPAKLTHAAAAEFSGTLKQAIQLEGNDVIADVSALKEFDSSALAVLLECRRIASIAGKNFFVHGLPTRLRQLAALYGVAELLPPFYNEVTG